MTADQDTQRSFFDPAGVARMEYRDVHGAFEIETRWKEQPFCWEGDDAHR